MTPVPDPQSTKGAQGRRFQPLARGEARPLAYLWEGYMQRGVFGILEGDLGMGKSTLLRHMAARLSRGLSIGPEPSIKGQARCSFFLLGEEDPARVHDKIGRMNGDTALVLFPREETEEDLLELEPGGAGLQELEDDVAALHPALVVIDPLTALAPQALAARPTTRRLCRRLTQIAQTYDVTIVAVRHLTKTRTGNVHYQGQGHVDLGAAARFILRAAPHPDQAEQRVLVPLKNSDGPLGKALAYSVEGDLMLWRGPADVSIEEITRGGRQEGAEADARRFWREALADGPRPTREVMDEGEQDWRINVRTLTRARGLERIDPKRVGLPGGRGRAVVFCKLPTQEWPPDAELARLAQEYAARHPGQMN